MKTSELRAKDAAGLEKEVSRPAEGPLRPAHAEGDAATHQPLAARQHAPRHRARQDDPGGSQARAAKRPPERRNERRRHHGHRPTAAAAEPRAKNTRTLIGKVVSDKRSKTITVPDRAPHQARALRQDRRQDRASTTRTTKRASTSWATWSRSPRAGRSRRPSRGS